MKRILCIRSSMGMGGAETFMMKLLRNIDRNEYMIDFLVSGQEEGFYEEEIKQLGGKVFRVPLRVQHPLQAFIGIKDIVRKYNYKNVLKLCDTSIGYIDLLPSKLGGAEIIAARSCNSSSSENMLLHLTIELLKPSFNKICTVKIAPSLLAAEYTFGKKYVNDVHLLKNGLNLDLFRYDDVWNKQIRNELNLNNKFVVGHIGRFAPQKNHYFLIDIFEKISKFKDNAVLLLLGEGELQGDIYQYIIQKGLADKVQFLGVRNDIYKIMSAMNVFVFPSLFEGMPNTVVEAQACGVPCFVADTITEEVKITDLVKFLPLSESSDFWADTILAHIAKCNYPSRDMSNELRDAGYDIHTVVEEFINLLT